VSRDDFPAGVIVSAIESGIADPLCGRLTNKGMVPDLKMKLIERLAG
jgi:hypothetical protein